MLRTVGDRVFIVLLNYECWPDTIECLESVLRLTHADFTAVVCDNGSRDGSVDHIRDWAEGREAPPEVSGSLRPLTDPPVDKPVPLAIYAWPDARGGRTARDWDAALEHRSGDGDPRLVVIRNDANMGFGAGNNTGMRFALAQETFDHVWLLNNDTVVEPDALTHLVDTLRDRPDAGFCGSTVLFYDDPETIQAQGGSAYNRWLGTQRHVGDHRAASNPMPAGEVLDAMDYCYGASTLVRRDVLEQVGLLCEDFFLYFDEVEWAARARGSFAMAYAPGSRVYHKEGATAGAKGRGSTKSRLADFHAIRNRLEFTRRYHPQCLPTVYLGIGGVLFNRVRRGQWDRLLPVVRLALGARVEDLLDEG